MVDESIYKLYLDTNSSDLTLLMKEVVNYNSNWRSKICNIIKNSPEMLNKQDEYGRTALMIALYNTINCKDIVKLLIKYGANINLQDNDGCTVLMCAILKQEVRVVKLLIKSHCDINIKTKYGRTGLIIASDSYVSYKAIQIAKLLIEYGADLNCQDQCGLSALMYASFRTNIKIGQMLINAKCSIDLQDNKGRTALMHAIDNSIYNSSFVRLLIKSGCNLILKNNDGKMAHELRNNNMLKGKCLLVTVLNNNKHLMSSLMHICSKLIRLNKSYYLKQYFSSMLNKDVVHFLETTEAI